MAPVLFDVAYGRMLWNAPLSASHAATLRDELDLGSAQGVLDLGCGWGEFLLQAMDTMPAGATGIGVDTDGEALARGRDAAQTRGITGVSFVAGDLNEWSGTADRVVCVGAAHAWGGAEAALTGLRNVVEPGGRLLFGDVCWERPPTPAARRTFDDVVGLADLVELAAAQGWRVLHLSTSDLREWDVFESSWRLGRQEWLMSHPDAPDHGEVLARVDDQLRDYVGIYRGVLGFTYLVLGQ